MPLIQALPAQNEDSYLGSMNMDTSHVGRAIPWFDFAEVSATDRLHYPTFVVETTNPTGNPRVYYGINKTVYRYEDGTETADNAFNDVVQGGLIVDNGSGTDILLVTFGSSTNPRVAYRSLTTDTTPWTTQTTSTYMQAWGITSANGDVYAVTDAGVAVLGEHRVSKCPAATDPTLAASYGAGIPCGQPDFQINDIAPLNDGVIAAKPNGLWDYDDKIKKFKNKLPHLEKAPHTVNGKGLFSGTNGCYYNTQSGHTYFYDGHNSHDISISRGKDLPRDVLTSRITAMTEAPDGTLIALTESFQNVVEGPQAAAKGMRVFTYLAGTMAEITTNVTDNKLSTGGSMATFGNAADDALFVVYPEPWEGISVRNTRAVNAASQAFGTPSYSNGTAGSTAPFDSSFTAFTAGIDGSILKDSGISLVNTGFPPGASNPVLTWTDIDAWDKMDSTTLTLPNGIGAVTGYWARWKRTTATGMTAGTEIDEVDVIPSRPGLPNGNGLTQSTNFTHREAAGCLGKVFLGRRVGPTRVQWFEVGAIHTLPGAWKMILTMARGSSLSNGGPHLLIIGRYKRIVIALGATLDPSRTPVPRLVQRTTGEPAPILSITNFDPSLFSDEFNPRRRHMCKATMVSGRYIQPADTITMYARWDESDKWFEVDQRQGSPAVFYLGEEVGSGRRFHTKFLLNDNAQTDNAGPYIDRVVFDMVDVGEEYDWPQDRAFQTPED